MVGRNCHQQKWNRIGMIDHRFLLCLANANKKENFDDERFALRERETRLEVNVTLVAEVCHRFPLTSLFLKVSKFQNEL